MSTTYEEQRTEQEKRIDAEVLARVRRGLAWLEETHGPGWEDKIDLATLNLRACDRCVLGQVYGGETTPLRQTGYEIGLKRLRDSRSLVEADVIGDAFCATNVSEREDWDSLQEAWEFVLRPRVRHG